MTMGIKDDAPIGMGSSMKMMNFVDIMKDSSGDPIPSNVSKAKETNQLLKNGCKYQLNQSIRLKLTQYQLGFAVDANELSAALNQIKKDPPAATVNPTPVTPVPSSKVRQSNQLRFWLIDGKWRVKAWNSMKRWILAARRKTIRSSSCYGAIRWSDWTAPTIPALFYLTWRTNWLLKLCWPCRCKIRPIPPAIHPLSSVSVQPLPRAPPPSLKVR